MVSLREVHALQNHSLSYDVLLRWLARGYDSWYCCLMRLVGWYVLFILLVCELGCVCIVGGMVRYAV